jgi:hypothetical protein
VTQCLTCYPTEVFFFNSCWASCPDGSSDYILVGDGICESCQSSCKTCSGSSETECLTCYPTKVFFFNSCWASCPDGSSDYILVGDGICESCHSSCKTCSGSSETECLTCYPTKVFFFNSCWASCPDGSSDYILVGDGICESCHSSCKTCSGSSETECLTCYPTKVFFSNSCWDSCPDGYYSDY